MASAFKRSWTTADGTKRQAYRVKYKDVGGRVAFKQFETKREANAFIETLSKVREDGRPASVAGITLQAAADQWVTAGETGRDGKPPLERATIAEDRFLLRVLARTDDVSLSGLDRAGAEALRDNLLVECRSRSQAIRVWTKVIRPTFRWARHKGWMTYELPPDIMIHADIRRDGTEEEFEVHTPEEVRAILSKARELAKSHRKDVSKAWRRYDAMINLLFYSGMRISEVRGLPRKAVDLEAGTVRVVQRADRYGEIGAPKSHHSRRAIYLPTDVMALLKEWMPADLAPDALVFAREDGMPLNRDYLQAWVWGPVQKKAGVPYRGIHAARHFYASRLIAKGATPIELQRALGHHDPGFTMTVYGHLFGGAEADARRRALAEAVTV